MTDLIVEWCVHGLFFFWGSNVNKIDKYVAEAAIIWKQIKQYITLTPTACLDHVALTVNNVVQSNVNSPQVAMGW